GNPSASPMKTAEDLVAHLAEGVHDQVLPTRNSSSRVIVDVDLDCSYAQVEMISNPELKDKTLGKLMNVRDAKEKRPQLVLNYWKNLVPLLRDRFDEHFVDLTETVEKRLQQLQSDELSVVTVSGHVYTNQSINLLDILHIRLVGSQIAAEMREAMYNRLGLTGCAGVASNKLLAKLASGVFKPNQQTVLLPESCQHVIHSLNHIKEIPGMGYETAKCLEALGINSVRDLQTFSPKILEKELGISVAQHIQKLSFGEDNSPVIPSGPPHEINNPSVSSEKHYGRESRHCPIPSHVIQKLGTGNYDVMTSMVDMLMKLFRNMVNVKMPFHLTLLSVCFCNLKALNTAKKGLIDYYITPSLSTTSRSGKHSFKMKDTHMEDFPKDKETNRDVLPSGRTDSTRTRESPLDTTNFSKEKDINEFPLCSLPEGVDQEVFKQLPVDIQEEILSGKSREKFQRKGSVSCPLHASRGVLSFFSKKQMRPDIPINPRDHLSSSKQVSSVSPCESGTSGLNSSSSSYMSSQKDDSYYLDNRLKDEQMSQGPKEPQGFHFTNSNPAVSAFHSFPDLQIEQLFSKNHTTDSHKQTVATDSHEGLTENREPDSVDEKITFPSDIDPQVFYELPEVVQKELLAEWKRTGSDFHIGHK
uniref:UmuC domain-containing protein n=1 Tax=Nomascus leucogenys TaxID=61853 RepID=A0A2I3GRW8_NOMLE